MAKATGYDCLPNSIAGSGIGALPKNKAPCLIHGLPLFGG